MNKKWKKRLAQSGMFILMMLVGYGIGMMAGYAAATVMPGKPWLTIAVLLVMLLVWEQLHVVVHEAGHLVCGRLTGYDFVSFRVGSHIWQKGADGRLHHGRLTLAGTGGQCLLSPPPMKDGRYPFGLYNAGGAMANFLLSAILGLAAWLLWPQPLARVICLEGAILGVAVGMMNIVPLPLAVVANDGSNLLALMRSPDVRQALWLQTKINALLASGLRLREMPEELFPDIPEEALAQPMVMGSAIMKANRSMDAGEFHAALTAIRRLLEQEQNMLPLYRAMLMCDGATLELLLDEPPTLAQALEAKETVRLLKSMKAMPPILRTKYIIALMRDHDPEAGKKLKAAFDKAAGTWPNPQEMEGERELMRMAEEKAGKA